MDILINGEKLCAIKYCYKRSQQLFLHNLSLHTLIIFIFTFWLSSQSNRFPPDAFSSVVKMVATPPPIFSSRCLFVVVNVIVLYIVGEQKLFGEKLSLVNQMYDEYHVERMEDADMSRDIENVSRRVEKVAKEKEEEVIGTVVALDGTNGKGKEKEDDEDEDEYENDFVLANKEFNKRAEAFIARVNKQRKLEAVDCFQYW